MISILTNIGEHPWPISTDAADLYPVVGGVSAGEVVGSKPHFLIDLCLMNCDDLPEDELFACLIRLRSATDWMQAWDVLKDVYRQAPDPEEETLRWAFYHLARKMLKVPKDPEILGFNEVEEILLQGGNVITIFERNEIICRERTEAEHAEIRAKGIAEGMANQRDMLRRLAAKRFDAETVGRVVEFVSRIDDLGRLFEVAELIVECSTGDELLDRLG